MVTKCIEQLMKLLSEHSRFIISLLCVSLLFFIAQQINNRFWLHDFEVYYSATNSFLTGKQVYDQSYGLSSGFYKYSPFALILFAPTFISSFYMAKVIHFFILACIISINILLAKNIIYNQFFNGLKTKSPNLLLTLILLSLLPHIYTELHLGNINSLLLFIFIIALLSILSGKEIIAGILIAVGILFKPHFIILLPFLLIRRKIRCLTVSIATLIAGVLLPAIFIGTKENIILHQEWLKAMLSHNSSVISGQDTIFGLMYNLIFRFIFPDVIMHDKIFSLLVLLFIVVFSLVLFLFHIKQEKVTTNTTELKKRNFIFEFILLLALVPSITKTDSEHFLFSVPLIAFLIINLFQLNLNIKIRIFAIASLFLFGMNIRELVGNSIADWLTQSGALGFANLLIILICIFIYNKHYKKSIFSTN